MNEGNDYLKSIFAFLQDSSSSSIDVDEASEWMDHLNARVTRSHRKWVAQHDRNKDDPNRL